MYPRRPCSVLLAMASWGEAMLRRNIGFCKSSLRPSIDPWEGHSNWLWIYVFNIVKEEDAVSLTRHGVQVIATQKFGSAVPDQWMPDQVSS